jgi:hypothetical protein
VHPGFFVAAMMIGAVLIAATLDRVRATVRAWRRP